MQRLRVAFDVLPMARWGPLFHLLCLERPATRIEWQRAEFPEPGRSVLEGADVGVRVAHLTRIRPADGGDVMALDRQRQVDSKPAGQTFRPRAGRDEQTLALECLSPIEVQRGATAASPLDSSHSRVQPRLRAQL